VRRCGLISLIVHLSGPK